MVKQTCLSYKAHMMSYAECYFTMFIFSKGAGKKCDILNPMYPFVKDALYHSL